MERSDVQLINNYLEGDKESLEILIGRYLKSIHSFVYKYVGNGAEAEDVTQEVFVKVWRNLKKFDRKHSFKTWIFTIAKNTAIDWLKKKKAIPFSRFDTEDGGNFIIDTLADTAPRQSELFDSQNIAQAFSVLLDKLSDSYRSVLLLHYNNNLTFREIAEATGDPLHTVKSRHRRALIKLKDLLISR